jgi:hypothetical protein
MMLLVRSVKRTHESAATLQNDDITGSYMVRLSQAVNDGAVSGKIVARQNRSVASAIETVVGTLREQPDILQSVLQRQVLCRYATDDRSIEIPC